MTTTTTQITHKPSTKQTLSLLQTEVESLLSPLGYEVVALERTSFQNENKIVLYIDFLENNNNSPEPKRIGLDDCVKANAAVDELFETTPLLDFKFSLEVSSPGVDRPLKKLKDFERFHNQRARIHTFRPLEIHELGNDAYFEKNKKQKNFLGLLSGVRFDDPAIQLTINNQLVWIPFELISKAHLEIDLKGAIQK